MGEWVKVAQLCLTLCNPMDYTPPGSSVHGILQARILEWVATSFCRGSSRLRNWTRVSCIAGRFLTVWGTREAPWKGFNPKQMDYQALWDEFCFCVVDCLKWLLTFLLNQRFSSFLPWWFINLFSEAAYQNAMDLYKN